MSLNTLAALEGNTAIVVYSIAGFILFILAILLLNFGMIWIRAWSSGAPVGIVELISLRLRSVPVGQIVDARITAVKSGIPLSIDQLSTHYLAGGSIDMVVDSPPGITRASRSARWFSVLTAGASWPRATSCC